MAKDKVDHDGTEQVTAEEVTRAITGPQLRTLLKLIDEIDDETAESRKRVKDAIEDLRMKKHVHVDKWGLGVLKYLRKLDTETMADKLDVLEFYIDASGLRDKAAKVKRLPLDGGDQRQVPGDGKVTPIRQAAE